MANSFWEGEKASREDARKSLMNFIADNWEGRFTVNFHSDDGGHLIQAVFEVDDTRGAAGRYEIGDPTTSA